MRTRSPAWTCRVVLPPMLTVLPSGCSTRFSPARAAWPPSKPYGLKDLRSDKIDTVSGLRYSICSSAHGMWQLHVAAKLEVDND